MSPVNCPYCGRPSNWPEGESHLPDCPRPPEPVRPKLKRVKDAIGWLLGYGSCPTCRRTMWMLREGEWQMVPTEKFGVGMLVCKEHLS